jgi:lysosomal Pro-X carboxypeptidase
MYTAAAQYNHPPEFPVTVICNGIDGASFGNNILDKIYSGVVAQKGNGTCKINSPTNISETSVGWEWQVYMQGAFVLDFLEKILFFHKKVHFIISIVYLL